jgi:hypothetical protein
VVDHRLGAVRGADQPVHARFEAAQVDGAAWLPCGGARSDFEDWAARAALTTLRPPRRSWRADEC